jgi:D-amino-acid dehydrogenase
VVAAGAWSKDLGRPLGIAIPVEPQRGQIIHLGLPGVDTSSWPIVLAFRGHYMVPWEDGRVAVGATRETGSGFRAHTTAAGIVEVLT